MKLLTEDAILVCAHELGKVNIAASQSLVTIGGRKVLVEIDPEGKTIVACPNVGIAIKPCTTTLKVEVGYSALMKVDGRRVCLDTVTGLTDGTPPGIVKYHVVRPGQGLVSGEA
jgi:hypothetical protein